jgi:hypothetical protein
MKYLSIILAIALMPTTAQAQRTLEDKITFAMNNLGHELVVCAAFFHISAIGNMNRGDEQGMKVGTDLKRTGDFMIKAAGDIGAAIGQKPEVLSARLGMAMNDMRTEMGNHFMNISILMKKHLQPCVDLKMNLTARIEEITAMARASAPKTTR